MNLQTAFDLTMAQEGMAAYRKVRLVKQKIRTNSIGLPLARLLFENGLGRLENAYKASIEQPEDTKRKADEIARKAFGLKPGQTPPQVYTQEDGSPSPDFGDELYTIEYEAEETSSLIREAFLIALFHFWERQSNLWLGVRGATYNHQSTMGWLQNHGYTPDEPTIRRLELAANCTKHGPGKSCDALYALDSTFFAPPAVQSMGSSRNFVQTTIPMMDKLFNAVRQSGPV